MDMKTRFLAGILCLSLLILCVGSFVACDGGINQNGKPNKIEEIRMLFDACKGGEPYMLEWEMDASGHMDSLDTHITVLFDGENYKIRYNEICVDYYVVKTVTGYAVYEMFLRDEDEDLDHAVGISYAEIAEEQWKEISFFAFFEYYLTLLTPDDIEVSEQNGEKTYRMEIADEGASVSQVIVVKDGKLVEVTNTSTAAFIGDSIMDVRVSYGNVGEITTPADHEGFTERDWEYVKNSMFGVFNGYLPE